MATDRDLKRLERTAVLKYSQDGLLDIVLGVFIFAWGFGLATDTAHFTSIWVISIFWIAWVLKEKITYPRIGYVKIKKEKQTLAWLFAAGVLALFIAATSYLLRSSESAGFVRDYYMFILGATIATITGIIAYSWRITRWYTYALAILAGVSAYQWLDFSLPWSFMVPGLAILGGGTAVFLRFLQHNPKQDALQE